MEPLPLDRRRAARQDARRRRPRSGRGARRPAVPLLRDAARGLRPVRERGPGPPARRGARARPRPPGRDRRLPLDPPAEDTRDDRALRCRAARSGQAGAADREHRARRHHRRAGARRRPGGRHDRGRRARCLRRGADHRIAALRARERRGRAAPRGVDGRSPGQGGPDDRRDGGARARGRVRPLRRQPRGEGGERHRRSVPAAGRAPRAAVHRAGRWHRRHPRGLLRGPDRRLRLQGADARRPEGDPRPGRRRARELRERPADRRPSGGSRYARPRSARRATT